MCERIGPDGNACGGLVGRVHDGALDRVIGGTISQGPTWCPKCGQKYDVRRVGSGRDQRVVLRLADGLAIRSGERGGAGVLVLVLLVLLGLAGLVIYRDHKPEIDRIVQVVSESRLVNGGK